MKEKLKEREFQTWAASSLALILVWSIVVGMFYMSYKKTKDTYLNSELQRFQGEVNSTLETYEEFANYIYDEINEDEEIISIITRANTGSEEEKKLLRARLYEKLAEKHEIMKKYKFRQLHFHLHNTESFLRVHAPEKYGDLLAENRESVRLVNEKMTKLSGFEEGKILNGFRNVYPLSFEDQAIGSVEISMSSASIIEILSKLHENKDFYFIVDKALVDKHLFKDEISNYRLSNIFENYYVDIEADEIISENNEIILSSKNKFFENIRLSHGEKIKNKESFSTVVKFEGQDYIVKFLSFENFKKDPSAYLISVAESSGYNRFIKNMYKEIILVSLLAFFIILFGLVLAFYQNRLKNSAELDYLTKVYNRNKFYKLVEREVKLAKRYKQNMSVILLDIDFFKKVNDTYGHKWGDEVLKELAKEISKNIREIDVFARWGGEEFVLLLPNTGKEGGLVLAEKIRKLIDQSQSAKLKDITISLGVAKVDKETYDINAAINMADQAMYEAKRNGRNQVIFK